MSLNSFTPNTKIESAKVVANFSNLANNGLWFTMKFPALGDVIAETLKDYLSLPNAGTLVRVDLVADSAPTGADLIVDIEKSTDGATWVTIFTTPANRPRIVAGSRTGFTTTIDIPTAPANTYYRAKIAQIGSTLPGSDLSIMVRGQYDLD